MSLLDVWVWFLILGTAAVFIAGCWVLSRLARRHRDDDPRAGAKVAIAIVLSLLLGAGGLFVLNNFQAAGVEGTHKTLTGALNLTIGESEYLSAVQTVAKRLGHPDQWPAWMAPQLVGVREPVLAYLAYHPTNGSIPGILIPKLQKLNQTLDDYFASHPGTNATSPGLPDFIQANLTAKAETLTALVGANAEAVAPCPSPPATTPLGAACVRQRTPHHTLWLKVQPLLDAGRDGEAEELVKNAIDADQVTEVLPLDAETAANNQAPCEREAKTQFCVSPLKAKALEHGYFDAHEVRTIPLSEGGPAAFDHQREFNHQMDAQMKWFGYSMVTGFMMAPFAFVGGAILRRAFVPSDTVGFRPYPGKSAGWFLLLGAFGVFAIPFAAWTLRDLNKRSVEGQIAL